MKRIRRAIVILITIVMMISSITVVSAEGTVHFSLLTSKTADNKKITVTVVGNSNVDIKSMSLYLQYPNDWVIPVSVSNQQSGHVTLASDHESNDGVVGLSFTSKVSGIENGNLCSVTFDVTHTFETDTTIPFQLVVMKVTDLEGEEIGFSAQGGSVIIAGQVSSTDTPSITLDKNELTLTEKETYQLVATIQPATATNKAVTYKSSNPTIVSVDAKGKITALKQGKATVTATINGGNSVSCVVTVKPQVKITSIILAKKEIKMKQGTKHTLTVAVLPDEATTMDLTYASSDTDIVTINQNGVMTAKSVGIATITVQTKDKTVKEKCIVTVTNEDSDDIAQITIMGKLLDEKNKPIKNRKLELIPDNITITTDQDGNFTFENIEKKDYTIYLYDKTNKQVQAKGTILSGDKHLYQIDIVVHNSNLIISEAVEKIEEVPVAIQKVKFATNEVRIKEHEEYQLIYTIEPKEATSQTIKFVAKDKNIVGVQQNGIVLGKAKGYTTIQALSQDGTVLAECIIHIDGADSNKRSYLIILVEGGVFFVLAGWFLLRYKKFKKRQERKEKHNN